MGQFWGMEQHFKACGDIKGVPVGVGVPQEGAVMLVLEPALLGSAALRLFASTRPVLLWANYLQNAFLILREIT